MNALELREAKSLMKQQQMSKNPSLARQLKRTQSRAAEEQKRMEILDCFGANGYVPPKPKESQPPKKTDSELIMESILNQF